MQTPSGEKSKPSSETKRPQGNTIRALQGILRERLRPLIVCFSDNWGGLEQTVVNDALDLNRLGIKASVICLEGSMIHKKLEPESGLRVLPMKSRPRDYFDFGLRKTLIDEVEVNSINLIHSHQPNFLTSITPWFFNNKQVVILASRHIIGNSNRKNPLYSLVYNRLDALIVMSEIFRQKVLGTHRLKERQVKVIRFGIDFDEFDPQKVDRKAKRAEWDADDKTIVIGHVGRIDPQKGQDVFIRAAAGVLKALDGDRKVKFVLVGKPVPGREKYMNSLEEMVKQFRIEDQVIFAGYQDSIPQTMAAFDLLVSPSSQDAFGLVAIEAMAMGCPVVLGSGGASEELVGDEEFGTLARPGDAFDLQHQIRYMIEHPKLRKQMGKKARDQVLKNYDQKDRLLRTLTLYERFLRMRLRR